MLTIIDENTGKINPLEQTSFSVLKLICFFVGARKLKLNKTLTISILDPISPGLNPDEFLNLLQKNIYEEIDKIV